ncbi:MAG: alanine racemase [Gammaproteobacteria bacterium]
MSRPSKIHIDVNALIHNFGCVRQLAPQSKILAIVKADAYGHGLKKIVIAAQSLCDAFGVCCLEEAIMIRDLGINTPIVLLEGFYHADELPLLSQYDLQCVVHHHYQLDLLRQHRLHKPLQVWLKINTGMHRLGFSPEDFQSVYYQLQQNINIIKDIRLMTHFSQAGDIKNSTTTVQIEKFKQISNEFPGECSLANSAGILAWPKSHAQWVRPGIMLYGISPFDDQQTAPHNLQPLMTFSSQLIAIQKCERGEPIGYGGHWICPEDMHIGVVAAGYADGYPHHAKNGTPVLVNGKVVPLVGRVAMDLLSVDLRQQPQAQVGDPVILWGKDLPVEAVAEYADTIPYELVCRAHCR